jgi:hypothetical protein
MTRHAQQIIPILSIAVVCIVAIAHSVQAGTITQDDIERPPHTHVRVLLGNALAPTIFTANGQFVAETDQGILHSWKKGKEVSIRYENGEYSISWNEGTKEKRTTLPVTMVPFSCSVK